MLLMCYLIAQSRECQKKAWSYHKVNLLLSSTVTALWPVLKIKKDPFVAAKQIEQVLSVRGDPDPLDLAGSGAIENEWLKAYMSIVFWACFNAFELKRNPERGSTHTF